MNPAVRTYLAINLFSLPTVMFGGFSLLRLSAAARLNDFQRTMFRAGHAHAGVLLVMSLAATEAMALAGIPVAWCWWLGALFLAGSLMQSGGMFVHMAIGRPQTWSKGNSMTVAGAALLAVALVLLAVRVVVA